jgi:hypothetical protein
MAETIEFDVVHKYSLNEIGISLKTICGNLSVVVNTKIDTGSTYCIFARRYAEGLNLDIESGIPLDIGTATGSFRAFGHEVEMEVLGFKFESTVYFAESEYFDRNVLGRIGWLNKVKLGLIDEEGKLFLSSYRQNGIS